MQLIETRPPVPEADPIPLQRPTVEDRRRAFAKAHAPALPAILQQARELGFDPTSLSAGTLAVRAVQPIEVGGVRYLAQPTPQEMQLRDQLGSLRNRLADLEVQALTPGPGQDQAATEQFRVQQEAHLVAAELYVTTEARQRRTVQAASGHGSNQLTRQPGVPVSLAPGSSSAILEEIEETY